jgi:hypothetical protein
MDDDLYKLSGPIDEFAQDRILFLDLVPQYLQPCGEDLVLLTLKGHLILETLLEMNLCRMLRVKSMPSGNAHPGLEFNQKLRLVRAVVLSREPAAKPNSDLFVVIEKLNSVRNALAHNLMPGEKIEAEVKRVIESYQAKTDSKLNTTKPLAEQLKACITLLCIFLDAVRVQTFKLDHKME